jgi:hypothetical protein
MISSESASPASSARGSRGRSRQQVAPLDLALLDAVELALHAARELDVEDVREEAHEELRHDLAEVGRLEAPLLELDVAAVDDDRDDARVGRGPADAELLELLDEAGLGEARRRLREVLLRGSMASRSPVSPSSSSGSGSMSSN